MSSGGHFLKMQYLKSIEVASVVEATTSLRSVMEKQQV